MSREQEFALRILLGTVDIAGQLPIFADGFRRLGHQVTTAVIERNPFYPHLQYDVEIFSDLDRWSWKLKRTVELGRSARLVAGHDLFFFQWAGTSFTYNNGEYALLRALGKQIVSVFCGADVRDPGAYDQQYASLIREKSCARYEDLVQIESNSLRIESFLKQLRSVRTAELYSNLILSLPNQAVLQLRPYMHFFVPVNLSEIEENVVGREIPRVVHAPSNQRIKGTDVILQVLDRLRSEGIQFDLRLLDGVPHHHVLSELTGADVVIDQLHSNLHGKLAVEGMAAGCAVATCDREEYEPIPPKRPLWHIGPENVYEQLKHLFTNQQLRLELGNRGRRYVEQYHDHVKLAGRILERLSGDVLEPYCHYPSFFASEYRLPQGVEIPEYLKLATAKVVKRWGLPAGVDAQDMNRRGLMSSDGLSASIPRWKPDPYPQKITI